jgi:multiple sugar transport system ATP-binding protein
MAQIVFEQVGKRYPDGFAAVRGLDLAIADGEFLVLVGPSGCGKSTALRMIAGLEEITEGRLLIDGVVANRLSPRARDVAMVFQSYALYPHLSVAENIGFGLAARGARRAEIDAKVRETAKLLELEDLLHRKPANLSGGQRQRVAMGRAIARRPKAFLMDEPLSNLDARLRGHMRSEIAQLQELTGVTTVYVTHDQIEAMTMGDRVAVMRNGELQQLGPPRELYDRPANVFVAGFIGAPTMNFLRVDIADGAAIAGGYKLPLPPQKLTARLGAKAILGIRPEALARAPDEDAQALTGRVAFVEDFGATQLAHLDIDLGDALRELAVEPDEIPTAPRLRALLDATRPVRAGERLRLHVDAGRVHLFDPDAEHAL